jgi:hypothetical protein
MKGHSRLLTRTLMLSVGVVVLIAGHGIILSYVLSHTTLSATVVSGVIILVVIKHLGWLAVLPGPLYALFRRRGQTATSWKCPRLLQATAMATPRHAALLCSHTGRQRLHDVASTLVRAACRA